MARTKSLMEVLDGVTRFGMLTVVGDAAPKVAASGFAAKCALVRCDCGTEKVVRAGDLRHGYATSCGCFQRLNAAAVIRRDKTRHGQSLKSGRSAEYGIWSGMKQRCHSPEYHGYANYGGRGIAVCDEWRESFEAFFQDVGPRPSAKHSLDRIDNDKGYEPGNVRWATGREQANNRRNNVVITIDGKAQTVIQWSRELSLKPMTIYRRLQKGWEPQRAVLQPQRGCAWLRHPRDTAPV